MEVGSSDVLPILTILKLTEHSCEGASRLCAPTLLKTNSLRAGFEPAREDPIGFQVQRLNHSAIAVDASLAASICTFNV